MDLLKNIAQYGLAGALAAFLLAQSAGMLPSVAAETKEALDRHQMEAKVARESMKALHEAQAKAFERLIQIQEQSQAVARTTCLNTAPDAASRLNCVK